MNYELLLMIRVELGLFPAKNKKEQLNCPLLPYYVLYISWKSDYESPFSSLSSILMELSGKKDVGYGGERLHNHIQSNADSIILKL